ncbi:MAG: hypothetical protein ABI948_12000, partial [Thermoleophilia bacterium]
SAQSQRVRTPCTTSSTRTAKQQFEALSSEKGILDLSDADMAALADRLRPEIARRLGAAP